MKGRILPGLGHLRLQAVTGGHLNGLYRELEDEGLSPASRLLTHAVLSRAFRDAVRWGASCEIRQPRQTHPRR
jgi:hypothetical protein